jgi:DNA-binding response OmpR family regulator
MKESEPEDSRLSGVSPVVLVVEDDPTFREVIRLTLLPLGVRILEAGGLDEARLMLRAAPDLVILDFYLQPEAGTDLLEDLAQNVPVLLLTGSLETSELVRKHSRLSAVLRKPFDGQELRALARQLLDLDNRGPQPA